MASPTIDPVVTPKSVGRENLDRQQDGAQKWGSSMLRRRVNRASN